MSESTDDAQLKAQEEVAPPPGDAPPVVTAALADADDVEVVTQAAESASPRHDSVSPTSRKLAPPPKPKRDSTNPGSVPPPAAVDGAISVGSIKAPSAPSISFHDAAASSREAVAAALSGTDSLRAIGEALAKDVGAFSTSETPTGGRASVPRPRSQPVIEAPASSGPATRPSQDAIEGRAPSEPPRARDKVPTVPDEPPASSTAAPQSGSIFAQRIISVGTRSPKKVSERPPAPQPPADWDRTLEAAPAPAHVETAQPPVVAFAPPPPAFVPPPAVVPPPPAFVPPPPPAFVPPPPPAFVAEPVAAVAVAPVAVAPVAVAPVAPSPAFSPPPIGAPPPPVLGPPPIELAATPARAPSVEITVDDDEAPPEIPITTDFAVSGALEEDTPTAPHASPLPLETPPPPPLSAPSIPDEPTPAPPGFAAAPGAEEVGPDSVDRLQVEELSREDSPSVPPEEPVPVPPPAPSARAEAKPPPPPKRQLPQSAAAEPVAGEGEKKKSKQKRPWWEELFSEDFVRANWKVSDEQIKREVTFVEESLGVAPGGVVLDLGCGSGQHAVELASRGYGVVGYDLSLYQLALAADIAQEKSQKINFLQGDMREMAFEEMFDGIFCWNTTFGYFEEDKNFSVAERAFRALRPGGMLLVDVINRDFVAAHTPSSVWYEGDSCVCMDDAVIDYFTSRLRVKRSVILDDGRTRECTYSVRLYSFHELGKLLHEVGFRVTEVSGHPATPGVFLGQASPRILMLAQRP